MNAGHFDIGTIQAFLDGELAHERVGEVSSHIGSCNDCAMMLARAEDESAFVFSTLESEFNTLVPTQRLWSKINDSIIVEKQNTPFWQKALAFVRASLTNPTMAAMASIVLVIGVAAMIFLNRTPVEQPIANVTNPKQSTSAPVSPNTTTVSSGDTAVDSIDQIPRVERAAYRPAKRGEHLQASPRVPAVADGGYLPGEESYVKTIDTLAKSVDPQNGAMMRPSERIAYERDLAVVNDSISKLRAQVKKNPKNESAKQVLYSSYQNKIDLLNSVSQKEELMASIGTR